MFTEGKWEVVDPSTMGIRKRIIVDNITDYFTIANIPIILNKHLDDDSELIANANLISAAPDMYEALREVMSDYHGGVSGLHKDTYQLIESALKKAEGKE